ncbi:MAG TPA: trypsin-like serine protease, partial [Microvirga sp.]|nr:trypsin-like serine protease [Microvirga sp.]
DARTTGTFRTASLRVTEPHGPSRILLWSEGTGAMGACQGDSGGPMASGSTIAAITSWSSPARGKSCGGITQGILLGPQKEWIDTTLKTWNRAASWEGR